MFYILMRMILVADFGKIDKGTERFVEKKFSLGKGPARIIKAWDTRQTSATSEFCIKFLSIFELCVPLGRTVT